MKKLMFTSFPAAALTGARLFAQVAQTTENSSNSTAVTKDHGKKVHTDSTQTPSYSDDTGAQSTTTTKSTSTTHKKHHGKDVMTKSKSETNTNTRP